MKKKEKKSEVIKVTDWSLLILALKCSLPLAKPPSVRFVLDVLSASATAKTKLPIQEQPPHHPA